MYKRIVNRLLLEADLFQWRRQTSFWPTMDAQSPNETVLFCDLFSGVLQAKVQTVFAKALQRKGYSFAVLMAEPISINQRIYRTAGDCRFFYSRDYITDEISQMAERRAEEVLVAHADFRSFFAHEIDGVRIGRNVLSTAARRMRVGSIRLDDSEHRETVRQLLIRSFIAQEVSKKVIEDVVPDVVLFCERGYTPVGELFDICVSRGIDTIQWLGAPQSDALIFKRYDKDTRANHPLALSDESWERIKTLDWNAELDATVTQRLQSHYASGAWFNRQQLQAGKSVKTPEEVRERLGLDPTKKTAVIFSHILYDATFFFGDSLFADYQTWLVETVRAAIANPNLNWVVKVHPVNVWKAETEGFAMRQIEVEALEAEFGQLPNHVRIMPADTDINTYSLFETIDYGLTVRGTIGMELPCFGIPVVTAGTGRYSGRGFTIDPESPEEFRATLARLHKIPRLPPEKAEFARKYAYGTFFLRPLPIRSFKLAFNTKTYRVPQLSNNIFLEARSPDEFAVAQDMSEFISWVSGNKLDYLAINSAMNPRLRIRLHRNMCL